MIPIAEINLSDINIEFISKYDTHAKNVVKYANIESAFDIETTSTEINGNKFAFMYEFTFGIKDSKHIYYGRNWDEFISLLELLKETFELSIDKRMIIYVHNLSFEFQFMRKYIEWVNVFSTDERKPIKALSIYGIEFRDSYILSGYSLAKLADNLTSHTIKKLVGDLNYDLVRTEKTFLTDNELAYCNNDVEILLDYINEQILQYGNITKIPLTNTGRVRQFVKNNCLHYKKGHKKEGNGGKIKRYRELMKECVLTATQYTMLKRCFMGGFTHASMKYSGVLMENVYSIDFTSSYPYVMLSEKFPVSKPRKIDTRNVNFWELVNNESIGLMFDCKIVGLKSKDVYETYLSESKCYEIKNAQINNGRIFSADELVTTITDIDLQIIKRCYDYDKLAVTNCYEFDLDYLPKQILLSVLELYQKKTTLKGVQGKEIEYLLNKGMLNSVYGMCVTDIVRGDILYTDNNWNIGEITDDLIAEQIEKYNDSKNRFLYYPWGVWVTAYARRNLWLGILSIGDDYIYSDTDSIKFINYDSHIDFIKHYNSMVEMKLKKMCDYRKIDFNLCKPKTIKGVEKLIGVWDYEGMYTRFKTLGAKRYMYEIDGKIHITIAGLSKQNGVRYLEKITNNDNTAIFDLFNNKLYIPDTETGKNTHTYIDDEMQGDITDYTGITTHVISKSSVHLSKCDFTLSISKQYGEFLKAFREGYIYKGVKYV